MKGRARAFLVGSPLRLGPGALSVAFNDRCDAIVATIVVEHGDPAAIEPPVIAFLNSRTVLSWAEAALGL